MSSTALINGWSLEGEGEGADIVDDCIDTKAVLLLHWSWDDNI